MTQFLSYFSITVAMFFLFNILFLRPAFKNAVYVVKFMRKKVILAVLVGFYLSFRPELAENDSYSIVAILAVLLYVFFTLAKDCPNGYAENAAPLLKAAFTFITFFSSFSLERKDLLSTIITIILLLSLCIITYFLARANPLESKSEQLELIFLCIEHFVALVVSSLLATNKLMQVVIMALCEEIVLVIIHLLLMYTVKHLLHENTIGFFSEKREELLS